MANSLSDSNGSKSRSIEDRNIKKERFKDNNANADMDMVVELPHEPMLSWKDRLMGKGLIGSRRSARTARLEDDDDFKFLERDVTRGCGKPLKALGKQPMQEGNMNQGNKVMSATFQIGSITNNAMAGLNISNKAVVAEENLEPNNLCSVDEGPSVVLKNGDSGSQGQGSNMKATYVKKGKLINSQLELKTKEDDPNDVAKEQLEDMVVSNQ
ncbi:hypothetical protein GOBAR_DD31688 [Gossypium barbadense]|nr:hypothetical protein GOBAR_DD31688 [Gossypium barbadense]